MFQPSFNLEVVDLVQQILLVIGILKYLRQGPLFIHSLCQSNRDHFSGDATYAGKLELLNNNVMFAKISDMGYEGKSLKSTSKAGYPCTPRQIPQAL